MGKKITTEEVKRIAKLAHIEIEDSELEKYAQQISEILSYVEKLGEVDTKGIEFKSHVEKVNVFREDVPGKSLTNEEVLQNRKNKSKRGSLVISSVL